MRFLVLLILFFALLAGCSTKPRQGEPAPVVSRDGSIYRDPGQQPSDVVITPLQTPAAMTVQPATNRAVQLLHERAQAQVDAGDYSAAAKTLERALSIQPDNARSWNLLAHLRANQQKYAMAAEIAAKSNSLASADQRALKKDNLLLMARMKSLLGDAAAASRYRKQANAFNEHNNIFW